MSTRSTERSPYGLRTHAGLAAEAEDAVQAACHRGSDRAERRRRAQSASQADDGRRHASAWTCCAPATPDPSSRSTRFEARASRPPRPSTRNRRRCWPTRSARRCSSSSSDCRRPSGWRSCCTTCSICRSPRSGRSWADRRTPPPSSRPALVAAYGAKLHAACAAIIFSRRRISCTSGGSSTRSLPRHATATSTRCSPRWTAMWCCGSMPPRRAPRRRFAAPGRWPPTHGPSRPMPGSQSSRWWTAR